MKDAPRDWPRISNALFYQDPAKAIEWLVRVFGFEVRLKVEGEGGRIEHSELVFGGGLIMVGAEGGNSETPAPQRKSPRSLGGANTQSIMVFVDDVDAYAAHARAEGATITCEPKTSDYGDDYWSDRSCEIEDLEGHRFWFVQRLRDQVARG